jgi:hypothetical protein
MTETATPDFFTLYDEFLRNPTELDWAFDRTPLIPGQKPRLNGTLLRGDLALARAIHRFCTLYAGRQVRVEYRTEQQPNLLYRAVGELVGDARTTEFVGTNGVRSHEAVLVRDSRVNVVEFRYIVSMELV